MFGYFQVRELIEISTLGEVNILGVKIGMKKETAAKILKPEYSHHWILKESKNDLTIEKYHKDEEIRINFSCYNVKTKTAGDKIIYISISRTLTKDKLERDNALKYYTDKLKPYLKESKTRWHPNHCVEDSLYDLGLNKVKISAGRWDMRDGRWYGILIDIDERTKEEYVKTNVVKSIDEGIEKYWALGCLPFITGLILVFNISYFIDDISSEGVFYSIVFLLFVIGVAWSVISKYKEKYNNLSNKQEKDAIRFAQEVKSAEDENESKLLANIKQYESQIDKEKKSWLKEQETIYQQKQKQLSDERGILRYEHNNKMQILSIKEQIYEDVLKGSLFKRSASMYADYKELEINAIETYLMTKKNPIKAGCSTAEELKKLKQSKREDVARYKEMLYKWEFLMNLFPELSKYVDNENDIQDLENYDGIDDFKENYDRTRDYLTEEEYRSLSEDERNQRALDMWRKRRKPSKWVAGVEYEMYCAYILRKKGFFVIEHGIQKGLNDLGIDLIAEQGDTTYIIQCKRYSNAMVHENTICQLFGTTLKYKIDNQNMFDTNITPMLLTTGELTDTAKEFAHKLGVIYNEWQMGEYPMIKCNINNGNKIYHLPFDQQYWRTIIEPEKGEFYATTVKEATKAGFRRAFKHYIN